MKIEHISISRQSCYRECQQKYKFRYELAVISPEPTPVYFTFGKIVHKIIEEHTRAKGKVPITDISKQVLSGKIELEPGTKAPALDVEHKNKLNKHLKNYMRLADKIGTDGDIEWKFKIDLDPPHERPLTGFIDRMIRRDNECFLIDYKTTKPSPWRKNGRTITKDLQLQCYCYIVMREFKIPAQNIQAALFYLDDYKIVPVRFSEQTLKSVPTRLLESFKEIEDMPADRVYGNVGKHCERCDYRKMCPFLKVV